MCRHQEQQTKNRTQQQHFDFGSGRLLAHRKFLVNLLLLARGCIFRVVRGEGDQGNNSPNKASRGKWHGIFQPHHGATVRRPNREEKSNQTTNTTMNDERQV